MEQKKFTEDEIIGKIDASFDSVDKLRLEGLEKVRVFHSIKDKALGREHKRLSEKFGEDHPKVKKISAKIRYNQDLFKDLDVEIEKANIKAPSFDKDSWMVHGRVLDKESKGVKGLTVGLFDGKGRWIKELGYGCTDELGYFSITYTQQGREEQDNQESMELFLYVSDKNHKVLYKDSRPLYLKIGQIDYREIYITDEEICSAPEPGIREIPPRKEEFGVFKLDKISGIDPKSAEKLRKAGIKDFEAFIEADEEKIKKILGNVDVGIMKKEAISLIEKKGDKR